MKTSAIDLEKNVYLIARNKKRIQFISKPKRQPKILQEKDKNPDNYNNIHCVV